MKTPEGFEPTLEIPAEWIEELMGSSPEPEGPIQLSYGPAFTTYIAEIGVTIAAIEADFEHGYFVERRPGGYYDLESASYLIHASPRIGKQTGRRLLVIDDLSLRAQPSVVERPPLRGARLRPIWDEVAASGLPLVQRQDAYRAALRSLEEPPAPERQAATPRPDETDGLWRYSALADLLDVLRLRWKLTPPVTVTGTVLPSDETTGADGTADRVVRIETADSLKGWRAESLVECSLQDGRFPFSTRIRDIDSRVLELDAPDGPLPKVGAVATVAQVVRFALGAHQRALRQFLRREVAGDWAALRALLASPAQLVAGVATAPAQVTESSAHLTAEQRDAVERAVAAPHAFFIQGPPGTGKTTVITEIIQRLVRRGERVLLLSSANVAVDEVLRRIEKKEGVLPVRLTWNASKVEPDVREYAYENAVGALVRKVLRPRKDRRAFWAGREAERGDVPLERVQALAQVEERWLAAGREEGAERAFQDEIGAVLLGAANLICATTVGVAKKEFAYVGNVDTLIVDEASRVTDAEFLIGAVRARRWILVGDEHQLPPHVEPEVEYLLLAMVACSMVEQDLSPTVREAVERLADEWKEEEELHAFRVESVLSVAEPLLGSAEWAESYRTPFLRALGWHSQGREESYRELIRTIRYFLIQSLFERGVAACPSALRARLTEQRRMIDPIARFVREPVYKGAYVSPSPEALARIGVTPLLCDAFRYPVTFLNTQFHDIEAAEEVAGTGFANDLEARWIVQACDHFEDGLSRSGSPGRTSVSILCFYREQSRRVRALLDERHRAHQKLQFRVIDAIDRIQGQESDIVLISFCRARHPKRLLGASYGLWLRDIRRLNVAFTRARRALVLVGHRPTLEKLGKLEKEAGKESFYANLFALFDSGDRDLQMVQDFGRNRRRR